MNEEYFDVVDKNDVVIKKGLTKEELHVNNDITRVVTLHLFNRDRKMVVAQRVATKKVDPLKFEAPAHGRVSSGEGYDDAVIRETKEELGVSLDSFIPIDHFYFSFDSNVGVRQHFKKLYLGFTRDEINFDPNEIKGLETFSSFEDFLVFYEENTEDFSGAVDHDIIRLKKFFADPDNQRLIEKTLVQLGL